MASKRNLSIAVAASLFMLAGPAFDAAAYPTDGNSPRRAQSSTAKFIQASHAGEQDQSRDEGGWKPKAR